VTDHTKSSRVPCRYCEGEGYVEDVDDYTADLIECEFCDGTGDAFGRGPTLPNPRDGESFAPVKTGNEAP
jgi:hypothetical protein